MSETGLMNVLSKYPQYKNYLSKSCIQTLEQYGGLLCEDEIREFETHPFYKYALLVSISDDYAKIPNCKYNDISYYKDMIYNMSFVTVNYKTFNLIRQHRQPFVLRPSCIYKLNVI